jgi:glutamate synthase (NADPH) small chain
MPRPSPSKTSSAPSSTTAGRRLGHPRAARRPHRQKVAVVGSGPAGLSAAAQLNRAGHSVTVFERADRVGGLLMYGIPNMKLDKKRSSTAASTCMAKEGITFVTNTDVGTDYPAPNSSSRNSTPSSSAPAPPVPRDLPIEGREPQGHPLRHGFLTANTKCPAPRRLPATAPSPPPARMSSSSAAAIPAPIASAPPPPQCRSLTQLEILPKPPGPRPR